MLFDHPLTGAGAGQGSHFSVQLRPAVLEDHSHSVSLHVHLQVKQVRWHLSLEILEKQNKTKKSDWKQTHTYGFILMELVCSN